MSQSCLANVCPILSQPLISNIANDKLGVKIGCTKCAKFGNWYIQFRESSSRPGPFSRETIVGPEARLTFHTTQELPLMRQWYLSNKNPSKHHLQTFAEILNSLPIRKERVKVNINKLQNWWKNERQRERRGPTSGRRGRTRKRKHVEEEATSLNPHDISL